MAVALRHPHWGVSKFFLVVVALVFGGHLQAQQIDTLRLLQYNLTNYGHNAFSCTANTNGVAKKDSLLRTILAHTQPDMIGFNEIKSISTYAQRMLQLNLNINGTTSWAAAPTSATPGSDLMNLFFYNSAKLGLKSKGQINSAIRLMDHYRLYVLPQPGQDTIFFNVIVAHLKAGNTSADRTDREAQVAVLNNYLATKDTAEGYIFQGDINVYSSTEVNYQRMVNPAQGGFFTDPINKPGNWNNNSAFAAYHTQCPSAQTGGCFSGGGMDDRFDQQLVTRGMLQPGRNLRYVAEAFRVIGNDGRHYNQDITSGTNNSAPRDVITALWRNSDHLPIMGKLVVSTPVRTRPHTAATQHRVWHQPDGLHLAGLDGGAHIRIATLAGQILHQADTDADLVPIPPFVSGQWLLVMLQPKRAGVAPSLHRVWYAN